jgi:hypothetical protein
VQEQEAEIERLEETLKSIDEKLNWLDISAPASI